MAAAAASATSSASLTTVRPNGSAAATPTKVVCLHNNAVSVLSPQLSADQRFGNNFMSMKAAAPRINKKRGSVFSTRSAASEIFNIASIMSGITLVGVAIGFVLLRIESSVEESAL